MSNSVKASSLPVTERTPSHVDLACLYSFSEQEEVNCMSPTLPDLLSPHSCLTASANPPAALRGGLVTPHQSRQPEMPSNESNPHRSDRAGLCFTVCIYIYAVKSLREHTMETKRTRDLEKGAAKYRVIKTAFLSFSAAFPFSLSRFRRVSTPYLPSLLSALPLHHPSLIHPFPLCLLPPTLRQLPQVDLAFPHCFSREN